MFYLDNAATTPLLPEVIEAMTHTLKEVYGNPSSINQMGRAAKQQVEKARQVISQSLGAKNNELIFTSGATESNNAALRFLMKHSGKKQLVISAIEHPSVYAYAQSLEKQGFVVSVIGVDERGIIDLEALKNTLTSETGVVSVMMVNNETGAIQPIEAVVRLAKAVGAFVHTDAVQAYGQLPIDVKTLGVDALSVSAHKIHGPKGIGALYICDKLPFESLLIGGSQESQKRAGTENVHNIVGFAKAVELLDDHQVAHTTMLQNYLLEELPKNNVRFEVNGSVLPTEKVSKIINLYLPDVQSSKLLIQLDLVGIIVSAGSACSAGSLQPSSVLLEQFPQQPQRASESIRVSFSRFTTQEDVRALVEKLKQFGV
ncbi:cysteine desulfurase [Carnobacteriaceae bacterium zg-C25]|nr:cysteine desulfurase [Carnobacteriaceae bacterium zg-C25]